MNQSKNVGVLAGIRVVDMGRFIAGPYCAALLADLGADVIRVEPPGGGEDRQVAPVADTGEGGMFLQCGRNKRALCLDLRTPGGRDALARLIATADVLVANAPEASLRELGIDYATLSARHPALIVTTVSAFGERGPLAGQIGFDGTGQALSGAAWMSGTPGAPSRNIATYVDYGTALANAFGTLAALRERDRSGRGQHVQASLLGTALNFFNSGLVDAQAHGRNRQPTGNRGWQAAPSDIFATRDGHVLIQVLGNAQFKRLARMVERPEWIDDPRMQSDIARGDQADVICDAVAQWTAARDSANVLAALADARIPAQAVLAPLDTLAHPHMREAGFFEPMDFPTLAQPAPIAAPPVALSATPMRRERRAPMAGEHSHEILGELGYSAAECEALAGPARL